MTKEEFKNAFVDVIGKHNYPYSCMTIQDLYNIIKSYKDNKMPFCIKDVWSWRGIYDQPCCYVTIEMTTKKHNFKMLDDLLNDTFYGWKGGEYKYNLSSLLHFESDESCANTLQEYSFWYRFLTNNDDNPFIQHMYKYFEDNKHLGHEYYQDYFGNDLKEDEECIYWTENGFMIGKIKEINQNHKVVYIDAKINGKYDNDKKYFEPVEFNKVIQLNPIKLK